MKNILVEVTPLDRATKLPVTIRMSHQRADASGTTVDGKLWLPVVTATPKKTVTLFGNGSPSEIEISYGSIDFITHKSFSNTHWSRLIWDGAIGRIWVGEMGSPFSSYTQIFEGTFGSLRQRNGFAQVTLLGADAILDVPLLSESYLGTGGVEGNAGLKGQLKPWVSGWCQNVEPILVDPASCVYQVHGYGPIQSITTVYENALDLSIPAPVPEPEEGEEPAPTPPPPYYGDLGSYSQLVAAELEPGQWATCLGSGLFRLANQASGKVTADVEGAKNSGAYPSNISAIAQHLLKRAGVSTGRINVSSLNVASGYTWGFYAREQTKIGEVVRDAYHQAGCYIFPASGGSWMAGDWSAQKSPGVLSEKRDRLPLVTNHEMLEAAPPFYRVKVGHSRCFSVHAASEISPYLNQDVANDVSDAKEAADKAEADAKQALKRLDNITADGVIERAEKANLLSKLADIQNEFDGIVSLAVDFGLPIEEADFRAAKTALDQGVDALDPALDDLTKDTLIDGPSFNGLFANYYAKRQKLLNAVARRGTVIGYLTNASHNVLSSSAGVPQPSSLAEAGGRFIVMSGREDVTANSTFAVESQVGLTMSINPTTGEYTLTGMSADTGIAILKATFTNTSVSLVYTATKAKAGADGSSPKTVILTSSSQTVSFNGAGVATPAVQNTTFEAIRQGSLAGVTWSITDATGVPRTPVSNFLTVNGLFAEMTVAQFNSARGSSTGVVVQASLTDGITVADRISVTKVQGGADGQKGDTGAPGSDGIAITGQLSNESFGVPADASGNVLSYAGAGGQFKIYRNGADVTSQCTFANAGTQNLTWSTLDGSGNYAITNLTQDIGWGDITATYPATGATLTKRFSVTKAKQGNPGAPGQPGTPGSPGSPGRPAMNYLQQNTPTGMQAGDLWYRPNDRDLYRYNGSTWERVLGDLASLNIVTADKILANELSAITGNLGTFTSTNANGSMKISGPLLECRYPGGGLAVRFGLW